MSYKSKAVRWTIRKSGDEWVAENGNGVFVYADHPLKLNAWIAGLDTPEIPANFSQREDRNEG